ncbi:MarR family winged helix-turn-helix transcriptional regulator [Streptomyces sp. NBC_00654]|uniref:MarR family winged helix-turn-helix transcriptional regulator n=1 Tax=Streptomyces sp. NBC_00654 TaxID=2975799 RepID=UPI00225B7E72|nr:MarR family winged helix-turn-helix transcriptional regulator [Streptomyces sp. NBC_00654]MCX4968590.1 MarR family winged helix-turn-helix transcriptional regulator [Streptomyces sp. NBC_00654]
MTTAHATDPAANTGTAESAGTADGGSCTDALPSAARGGPLSHAVSRISRLHRITAGKLLRGLDLYPGQEFLMMHLWDAGAVRQSELIRALDLDPSTVTKMLQRLEQTGHVRRRPDPADRRAVLVEATDGSSALRTAVEAAWTSLEEHTLAGLGPAERAELARLLAKVESNLCAETEGCPGVS